MKLPGAECFRILVQNAATDTHLLVFAQAISLLVENRV